MRSQPDAPSSSSRTGARRAMGRGAALAAVAMALRGPAAAAAPESAPPLARIRNATDQAIALAFLEHARRTPNEVARLAKAEQPEDHCWQTFRHIGLTLTAYRLTRDPMYLDLFVRNVATMEAALTEGTDGFRGWYGKAYAIFHPDDKPDLQVDVMITSFRAVDLLCAFILLIDAEPALAAQHAAPRARYLELMTNHLVRKWDVRGNYVDLGRGGAVYRTHAALKPVKGLLTQPHNKHDTIGGALISLYRVTGDDAYLRKAIALGLRFKRCLALKDGHYEWNYWDPAGDWDVHPDSTRKWKHWLGVEHKGGYYASSLTQAVRLHAEGLVFDAADIARFVKTQTEVCWNGNTDNPVWARCDGSRSATHMQGEYMACALAPYDDRIAAYCGGNPAGQARQRAIRLANRASGWQGGVVADRYIRDLIAELDAAISPSPQPLADAFLADPANRAWYNALDFNVTPPGYTAPVSPARMITPN